MRFIVSCEQCTFKGDATDIRSLAAQINSHASTCDLLPLIVLEEGNSEDRAEVGDAPRTTFVE